MNNLKKNYKTLLWATVFSIAILTAIFLIILPLVGQIKKSSGELISNRLAVETFYANWQNLKEVKKEITEVEKNLNEKQPILAKSDVVEYIKSLESIADRTANRQKIVVLEEDAKTSDSVKFQISLEGSFPNLMKFLASIENLSYCSEIKTINVTNKNSQSLNLDAAAVSNIATSINLSVSTY